MRSKTDIELYLDGIKGELDSASMRQDYNKVIRLMVKSSSAVCDEIDFLCGEIGKAIPYVHTDDCPPCAHLIYGEKCVEELPYDILKFRQCTYYLIGADLFEKNGNFLIEYPVSEGKFKTFKIPTKGHFKLYSPRKSLESEFFEYYLDTNFRLYESLESFLQFYIATGFDMDESD